MKLNSGFIAAVVNLAAAAAFAGTSGPYLPDAATLQLYHFEGSGADSESNAPIDLTLINGASVSAAGYPGFGSCLNTYDGKTSSSSPAAVAPEDMALSNFTGADGSFTFEGIVQPITALSAVSGVMQIISGEGDGSTDRGWQFRVTSAGKLEFINLTGTIASYTKSLPTSGDHAWAAGQWYHVAVTYNGQENTADNLKLYWTALDSDVSAAVELASFQMTMDLIPETLIDFAVGCDARSTNGYNEHFEGLIDEVRISSIARLPGQMLVTAGSCRPLIVTQPTDTLIKESQTARFQVDFTSDSPPLAQWYKEGSPADIPLDPTDPNIRVSLVYNSQLQHYESVLSIAAVEMSERGLYYCQLNNALNYPRNTNRAELIVLGLIANWSLDQGDYSEGQYLDLIGGYHAAATGEPVFTAGADGLANGAVMIDLMKGWAVMPELDPFAGSNQLTLSLWANWQGVEATAQDLTVSRYFQTQDLNIEEGLRSDTRWQHVCAVFDGSTCKVYVDGSLHVQGGWALPADATALISIGSNVDGGDTLSGALDDIRIYNYAMSGAEIAGLYTNTCGSRPMGVLRQWWLNLEGSRVSDLTSSVLYPDSQDGWEYIGRLEGPVNWAENYGTRIRGYLIPPQSGAYTFWIAGDDYSELWLGSDAQAVTAARIANVPGWSSQYQWDKFAEQQSAAIYLQAGRKYYIEILHKEGHGGDHLAVAWQGPGFSRKVIAGAPLRVWSDFLRGDISADGTVNMLDLAEYSRIWLNTDCELDVTIDLNGDCVTNMADLLLMTDNWLETE